MESTHPLLLIVGLALVLELFFLIRFRPILGLWSLMTVSLLEYSGIKIGVEALGYQIYALDIVIVILAVVSIERRLTDEVRRPGFGILVVLFAVAIARGLPLFGAETAVNASRQILYLLVGIAFASTCALSFESAQKVWVSASVVISVKALVFWLDNGLGTYARDGSRALFWAEALIVSQAGIMLLAKRERIPSQVGALFLLVVVLSQQRTVWATTIVAVVIGALSENRSKTIRGLSPLKTRVAAIGFVVAALVVIGPSEARQSFSYATSNISTGSGTFGWRVEGWVEIIRTFSNGTLVNRLIGQPIGTGFERRISLGVVDVSPHNMYIATLLSLGILGAIAFFTLLATAVKRSLAQQSIVGAIVGGLFVHSIGYEIPHTSGILIGIALTSQALMGSRSRPGQEAGSPAADTGDPSRQPDSSAARRTS